MVSRARSRPCRQHFGPGDIVSAVSIPPTSARANASCCSRRRRACVNESPIAAACSAARPRPPRVRTPPSPRSFHAWTNPLLGTGKTTLSRPPRWPRKWQARRLRSGVTAGCIFIGEPFAGIRLLTGSRGHRGPCAGLKSAGDIPVFARLNIDYSSRKKPTRRLLRTSSADRGLRGGTRAARSHFASRTPWAGLLRGPSTIVRALGGAWSGSHTQRGSECRTTTPENSL